MNNFATLDDSMYYDTERNFYVYTHALVLFGEIPNLIYFVGKKEEIYLHEDELYDFVEDHLPMNYELYACTHYRLYESIDNLVFDYFSQHTNYSVIPKNVHDNFTKSHHAAKNEAKRIFLELVNNKYKKRKRN